MKFTLEIDLTNLTPRQLWDALRGITATIKTRNEFMLETRAVTIYTPAQQTIGEWQVSGPASTQPPVVTEVRILYKHEGPYSFGHASYERMDDAVRAADLNHDYILAVRRVDDTTAPLHFYLARDPANVPIGFASVIMHNPRVAR